MRQQHAQVLESEQVIEPMEIMNSKNVLEETNKEEMIAEFIKKTEDVFTQLKYTVLVKHEIKLLINSQPKAL